MSAVPKKRYSPEEYLALEEKADYKSEYYDGEIFAMAGATSAHVKICGNLFFRLKEQLRSKPCFPMNNDMKVRVEATGLHAYPDIIVVCGQDEYANAKETVLLNPTVLIEVESPSTQQYDRTIKVRHYELIPSLQECLIVAQDQPHVERFERQPDNTWKHYFVTGLDSTLMFSSIDVKVPLAEIYERVTFPEPDDTEPKPN